MGDAGKLDKIVDWATKASLGSLLLAILVLGQAGVWVWGAQYESLKAERDEWKAVALKAARVIETSTFRPIGDADPVAEIRGQIQGLEAAQDR